MVALDEVAGPGRVALLARGCERQGFRFPIGRIDVVEAAASWLIMSNESFQAAEKSVTGRLVLAALATWFRRGAENSPSQVPGCTMAAD